ncbi:hypothetical protein JCM8547_008452 [Rhodosporidiobolus lusitaniae]
MSSSAPSHPLPAPPPPGSPPLETPTLKLTLIGPASSGKTSLRAKFVDPSREWNGGAYRATIGCDFLGRRWRTRAVREAGEEGEEGEGGRERGGEGREVMLQVWDTAGQERFRSLAPAFYRSSHACVLVYSLTSPSPPHVVAREVADWFDEFRLKAPVGPSGDREQDEEELRGFTWVAVGTKADEADERGEEGRRRAREIQEAVEGKLEELLPRLGGRGEGRGREASEGGETVTAYDAVVPPPPTLKVAVLPPRPRHGKAAKLPKPPAVDPTQSAREPPPPEDSTAPPPRTSSSSSASADAPPPRPSSAASTLSTTSTFSPSSVPSDLEPPSPTLDLLQSTSPPSPPPHFGNASAPPAVWIGGPFQAGEETALGVHEGERDEEEVRPDHREDDPRGGSYVPEEERGKGKGKGKGKATLGGGERQKLAEDVERAVGEPAGGEGAAKQLGLGLEDERERVEKEEEFDWGRDGIKHFRRTSALTGEGVEEVFNYIALRTLSNLRRAQLKAQESARKLEEAKKGQIIRVNEHEKGSTKKKIREACCS